MTKKKQHGGKREGAGRKPLPPHLRRNQAWVRLEQWKLDRLSAEYGSVQNALETLVNRHLGE